MIPACRTSFPFLSPPESGSAPTGCEIPPGVQTLPLAWNQSLTQTPQSSQSVSFPAGCPSGRATAAAKPDKQSSKSRGRTPPRRCLCLRVCQALQTQTQGNNSSTAAPLKHKGPIWSTLSSAGLPSSRKMRSCWRESSGGLRG